MGKSSILFVLDVRRYQQDVIEFAQAADRRGATIVLLTDPWRSPAAQVADHMLTVPVDSPSVFDVLTPGMAMAEALVGAVAGRLDEVQDWSRVLSLGEQQRIAFARVLVNRPAIVFLDEATSATDEGLEHMLYSLLRGALPDCMLVSVGHRSTLDGFHTHRLDLQGSGRWQVGPMPAARHADALQRAAA